MKMSSLLLIVVTLALSSCGISAQYTSSSGDSMFQDGIYENNPSFRSKAEKADSRAKTDALIEETKASSIYLFGDKKDTVMIPQNMSASIRYDKSLSSTVVTVGENPYSWQNSIDPWFYYAPYSFGYSWYWGSHFSPWYGGSMYWGRWHSPYYYCGIYDPWYYGSFYDPWYYGGFGYYPYHFGWYNWDPYWGYHHHHYIPAPPSLGGDRVNTDRRRTGSERVFTCKVSTRASAGNGSRVTRVTSQQPTNRVTTASRSTTSASRATVSKNTSAARRTSVSAPVTKVANHRRPSATTTSGSSVSRSTTDRPSSTSYRSSTGRTYESSSYNRSSTTTYSSPRTSSYSGSSTSRGSYGGGGVSRSAGGRR